MAETAWRADPLTWGAGPQGFEVFLEPTCPFSCTALLKLDALLDTVGPERLTIHIRLHSQPWHMFSGIVTRAIIAASTLPQGKDAAKAVMHAVAAHREDYEFERHAGGHNMQTNPAALLHRLEQHSGIPLIAAFATPGLDREIKWHCRYARQNGIHVSPTFMIDGLVAADLSSGDTVDTWAARIRQSSPRG